MDTGAEGTVIVPNSLKQIQRQLRAAKSFPANKVHFDATKRHYQSVFGKVTYRLATGFKLIVPSFPGSEVAINCSVSLLPGILGLRARRIEYNLLGRNVLEHYTLYMDRPGIKSLVYGSQERPIAFLTDDGEKLDSLLADGDETLGAFLQQQEAPPTDDIDWLGPKGKPI